MMKLVDRLRAEDAACAGVPTEALTPGRMAELIRQNAKMRQLLARVEQAAHDAISAHEQGHRLDRANVRAIHEATAEARALFNGEAS